MPRYTWRKQKRGSMGFGALTYTLHHGSDEVLATAQESSRGSLDWFWYGSGMNTAGTPVPLPVALDEARRYVKRKKESSS